MRKITWQNQFKRDFKIAVKRQRDLSKLDAIITDLQKGKALLVKNKNHKLKGNYIGCHECHVEPDWLLIYQTVPDELILVRTGTHSDLF